jgi:hypothetical protein
MARAKTPSHPRGLDAVVWLDPPLLVERSVAGRSYNVLIGGKPTRLTVPNDGPTAINMSRAEGQHQIPDFPRPQLPDALFPKIHAASGVGLVVPETQLAVGALRLRWNDPEVERTGGELGGLEPFQRVLGDWLSTVRDWLTAWSGNPRDALYLEPRPVVSVARVDDPAALAIGAGGDRPVFVMGQRASTAAELRAAFAAASREEDLPLERQLLAEAIVYAHRAQNRHAVITACSAAEVALSSAAREMLLRAGRTEDEVEAILGGVTGLIELYRLNSGRRPGLAVSIKRVMDQLARPRNRAVHQGAAPDKETVKKAIQAAKALLGVSPLREPR